ncbi:MAG: SdpI family protein [Eubacteriales bacterium]
MWFWVMMFCFALFIPLVMLCMGFVMRHRPPKTINDFYGYRTALSKKNQDTWDFAHRKCGEVWWRAGWGLLVLTVAVQLPLLPHDKDTVSLWGLILCLVQCVLLILSVLPVERALRRTFHPDGSRK